MKILMLTWIPNENNYEVEQKAQSDLGNSYDF